MKVKFALAAVSALLLIPAAFAGTFAGADDPLTGSWKCKLKVDGGQVPDQDGQMDLQQKGKDVSGTGTSSAGSAPIKGTFEDGKYKLTVEAGDANWTLEGKLDGAKLVGTWGIPAAGIKGTSECGKDGGSATASAKSSASASADLAGLWKCTSKVGDSPESPFQLELEVKGDKVSGTGSNAAGSAPLTGTFKDGKFQFKVEAGDTVFEFEGKLEGGKISGTLNVPSAGVKGTFEGKKG